jgi:hypothetical protein
VFDVTILHQRKDVFAGHVPDGLVEDLDLDWTRVPGFVDGRLDAPELDDPVSHHGARRRRTVSLSMEGPAVIGQGRSLGAEAFTRMPSESNPAAWAAVTISGGETSGIVK